MTEENLKNLITKYMLNELYKHDYLIEVEDKRDDIMKLTQGYKELFEDEFDYIRAIETIRNELFDTFSVASIEDETRINYIVYTNNIYPDTALGLLKAELYGEE